MDTKTGKIYAGPTDDEIIKKQLTRLSNDEYDYISTLPEEERPAALALRRYCKSRADLGRTNIPVTEKVAFKLGFKAGREGA